MFLRILREVNQYKIFCLMSLIVANIVINSVKTTLFNYFNIF